MDADKLLEIKTVLNLINNECPDEFNLNKSAVCINCADCWLDAVCEELNKNGG